MEKDDQTVPNIFGWLHSTVPLDHLSTQLVISPVLPAPNAATARFLGHVVVTLRVERDCPTLVFNALGIVAFLRTVVIIGMPSLTLFGYFLYDS